jgi:hypothetical protein
MSETCHKGRNTTPLAKDRKEESMKKFGLCCITLNMVLLAAVPTLAVLHASLENPSNVQAVSGITTLSGWAFSTLPDTPVRVKLRIDGITLDPRLPCCSPRLDVVTHLTQRKRLLEADAVG